jgi:predicted ATPase with chaperone activity
MFVPFPISYGCSLNTSKPGFTVTAYDRILKVNFTIADLDNA